MLEWDNYPLALARSSAAELLPGLTDPDHETVRLALKKMVMDLIVDHMKHGE